MLLIASFRDLLSNLNIVNKFKLGSNIPRLLPPLNEEKEMIKNYFSNPFSTTNYTIVEQMAQV